MDWLPFYKAEQALADHRHLFRAFFDALEAGCIECRAQTPPPPTGDDLLDGAAAPTPEWWRAWNKANKSRRYGRSHEWDFWLQHNILLRMEHVRALVREDQERMDDEAATKRRIEEGKVAAERERADVRALLSIKPTDRARSSTKRANNGRPLVASDNQLVARLVSGHVDRQIPTHLLWEVAEEAYRMNPNTKLESHARRLHKKARAQLAS